MHLVFAATIATVSAFSRSLFTQSVTFGAPPPDFGSYDLRAGLEFHHPKPYIDLQFSCTSDGVLEDNEYVSYYRDGMELDNISCREAFLTLDSFHGEDVCSLELPLNDEGETLFDLCNFTLCMRCDALSEIDEVERDLHKEFSVAPGFSEAKEPSPSLEISGLVPPMDIKIDDSLDFSSIKGMMPPLHSSTMKNV